MWLKMNSIFLQNPRMKHKISWLSLCPTVLKMEKIAVITLWRKGIYRWKFWNKNSNNCPTKLLYTIYHRLKVKGHGTFHDPNLKILLSGCTADHVKKLKKVFTITYSVLPTAARLRKIIFCLLNNKGNDNCCKNHLGEIFRLFCKAGKLTQFFLVTLQDTMVKNNEQLQFFPTQKESAVKAISFIHPPFSLDGR